MSSIKKLERSKLIIEEGLSIYLKKIHFEPKLARIHIILRNEISLFIRYNNHDECEDLIPILTLPCFN